MTPDELEDLEEAVCMADELHANLRRLTEARSARPLAAVPAVRNSTWEIPKSKAVPAVAEPASQSLPHPAWGEVEVDELLALMHRIPVGMCRMALVPMIRHQPETFAAFATRARLADRYPPPGVPGIPRQGPGAPPPRPCPKCGAGPGMPCTSPKHAATGEVRYLTSPHRERHK